MKKIYVFCNMFIFIKERNFSVDTNTIERLLKYQNLNC